MVVNFVNELLIHSLEVIVPIVTVLQDIPQDLPDNVAVRYEFVVL